MKTATALAATALAVAVFGSTPLGHAAARLVVPTNSVGAAQLKKNAVTGLKVKDGTLSAADFQAGQLPAGAQGPQGPAGPKGDKGEKGDPGISLYANVSGNGTLKNGTATASSRANKGDYRVTFARDVSKCAAFAEAGGAMFSTVAVGSTAILGANGTTVIVEFHVWDSPLALFVDTDFHLIVVC